MFLGTHHNTVSAFYIVYVREVLHLMFYTRKNHNGYERIGCDFLSVRDLIKGSSQKYDECCHYDYVWGT